LLQETTSTNTLFLLLWPTNELQASIIKEGNVKSHKEQIYRCSQHCAAALLGQEQGHTKFALGYMLLPPCCSRDAAADFGTGRRTTTYDEPAAVMLIGR